jgi:hypothetical protein
MNTKNIIEKGINQSIDKMKLPNDSLYMNLNGKILHLNKGSLRWSNDVKNSAITIYRNGVEFLETILRIGKINNQVILFTQSSPGVDSIGKIVFRDSTYLVADYIDILKDVDLGLSLDHYIIDFFSVYENENIQKIYWNDGNVPPRSLNIVDVPNPFYAEMLNFTPPYSKGEISYTQEVPGNLLCGTYFYTFRLISQDGAATDYQNFTAGINVGIGLMVSATGMFGYQNFQGDQSNQKSNTGNKFTISNIDTRYKIIEIVAFRSTDYNVSENGVIVAKLNITGATMYFEHTGSENLGSININDVIITKRYIKKVKSMEAMKNRNSLANFDEREEITETVSTGGNIDNYRIHGVVLDKDKHEVPVDIYGMNTDYWTSGIDSAEEKPLKGVPLNHTTQLKNQWYYNTSTSSFVLGDGVSARTLNHVPYIRIKKYKKANGTIEYDNIPLINEFVNYKGKKVSEMLKTYRGQETYRFGILPIDKETGKYLGVRWIGDREMPIRSTWWKMAELYKKTSGYTYDQINMNILKVIINNLDISDLVTTDINGDAIDCKISGFHVVRAPLDAQVLSEGVLLPVLDVETGGDRRGILAWPGYLTSYDSRQKRIYQYHSPEHLFKHGDQTISSSDVLKLITYFNAMSTSNDGAGLQNVSDHDYYQKYVEDIEKPASNLPEKDAERTIQTYYDIPVDISRPDIAIPEVNLVIKNMTRKSDIDGLGCETRLFITTEAEAEKTDCFAVMIHKAISYVSVLRKKSNLYGGTTDAALAATNYISTGHYQEITLDILNNHIKQINGKFIFNEIEVFGGDMYMDLFDLQRITNYAGQGSERSNAIFFPICSKVNNELRKGRHAAKDRCLRSSNNPTGIGFGSGVYNDEQFNYNDAYSTDNIGQYFNPLPYGFSPKTKSPMQIIYSPTKVMGESIDSYRVFPSNNVKSVDSSFGPIICIRKLKDYMLYWQENGLGYLPMNERIMTNNVDNQPVQLGIGGVYDRFDTKTEFYGCQHPGSIVKTEYGYAWFDFEKKAFLYLDYGMKLTDESIIKGLEPYFQNNIDPDLKDYNVSLGSSKYGIYAYYDENYKEVVMAFKQPNDNNFSVGFSERMKQFINIYSWVPNMKFFHGQNVFSSVPGNQRLYIHDQGTTGNNYGTNYKSNLVLIVNNPDDVSKIFDNIKVIGNNNFFSLIRFRNEKFGTVTENCVDLNNNKQNRYLQYINGEWIFALPFDSNRSRLRGHYMEIEFEVEAGRDDIVELLTVITKIRKAY